MNRLARCLLAVAFVAAMPVASVRAQNQPRVGAAPAGDAAMISQRAIHENFTAAVCPRVTEAQRQANGSIHAVCDNGETFRVFDIGGRVVAMRCAAAARYGVGGC